MRVLQLSPFAIPAEPQSGGLIRVDQTARAYERAGCQVVRCCIVTRERDRHGPLDVSLTWWQRAWRQHLGSPHHLGPLRILWASRGPRRLGLRLKRLLDTLEQPFDIVHLEHPWGAQLLDDLLQSRNMQGVFVVYGSHNIESRLLADQWRHAGSSGRTVDRLVHLVQRAEQTLARRAGLCWAVSDADATELRRWGAPRVVVAANGCRDLNTTEDTGPVLPGQGKNPRYALFVGGHYPPNIEGFLTWVGPAMAQLPAQTCIVVVGGAGEALTRVPGLKPAMQSGRLVILGRQSVQQLDRLLKNAHLVMLPVETGGGTNLKTAEALLSGRPIVSTPKAMQGFEAWADVASVHVEESPADFAHACVTLLGAERAATVRHERMERLTWTACLNEAVAQVIAHAADKRTPA